SIVAEFAVDRLLCVGNPVERPRFTRRNQPRVFDLEAARQIIGNDDTTELWLRLGHCKDYDEALVLRGLARINLLLVERMIAAFDFETLLGRRLWQQRRPAHRNNGLNISVAVILDG